MKYRVFTNVQATDSAGASSQTQLDVAVRPGPNIRPPFFTKLVYTAQVSCRDTEPLQLLTRDCAG